MGTVTGVAGTSINAACSVTANGQPITEGESETPFQSVEDDLATIKSGDHTFAGNKTFSGHVHLAQSKSLIADGSGCTIEGTWTVADGSFITSNSDLVLNNYAAVQRTITGATNATPIVITTSANHTYSDGDKITVEDVDGNTAANGTWSIDVQSGTTFALVGSAGNGAYTGNGDCYRSTQTAFSAARTVTRALTSAYDSGYLDAGGVIRGWVNLGNGEAACYCDSPTTTSQYYGFHIDVPDGAIITEATMYIQPAGGHGGTPGTLPTVTVTRFTFDGAVASNLGTATLGGTNPGYSAVTVTLGTPEIVDRVRCRYSVWLTTETGVNALDNTHVHGATVTFTTRHVDQF